MEMFFKNEWEPWVMVLYLFNVLTPTRNDLQLTHTWRWQRAYKWNNTSVDMW